MAIKKIGIIVGGGPAPGINGVIAAVAIEAINIGCTPLGFHDGFEWLVERFTDEQHELTIDEVSRIHLDGGSLLGTSRTDITRDRRSLENAIAAFDKLGVDALVCIGGDDMIRSAVAIEQETHGAIKVVLVPKSIDNDVWMPLPVPTLGHETARHIGVELVKNLMEDARTTVRWYFGVTMGRPTGHLTLAIGKAASATCTIIPEEFRKETITLDDICDIIEGAIIKRRASGRDFGVVLMAEALAEHLPEEVVKRQGIDRDEQGNIRVTEIDLGHKVKTEVQARLERRGFKVTMVDKTIGDELRCASPIPYDAEYARDLGYAAVSYLKQGGSGAMMTLQGGEAQAVPFADLIDAETGRGRRRAVDVDTESYQVARDYMVRLGPKDFTDAAWLKKLAEVARMSEADFKAKFGKFAH
ncbi:MAG: ATP-dependent phosphofructokinase / diphosphate-dependent phosphofructokinase [Blastocatellia bacterium]